MPALTPENFDRLAKAMMERHGISYRRARQMLGELKLHLVCGEEIRSSAALQAALLTAINTGKRAFRGGVVVDLPDAVRMLLPWPGPVMLEEVVLALGGSVVKLRMVNGASTLIFGTADAPENSLRVVCDGWRGGVLPPNIKVRFEPGADFALAGVFAGALGVARTFLSASQITHRDVAEPTGLSLWRPDLSWVSSEARGPVLEGLPAKLWILGLGHLGQAYAWTLSLLPFAEPAASTVFLQDFDEVEDGNWSAGLLCERAHVGKLKTRLCAEWLEQRGFRTRIVERRFDENTKRGVDEPRVALCGFDNPESRQLLENAGFELVVESGLGSNLHRFDRIVLHTFPEASQKPADIWAVSPKEDLPVDLGLFEEPEAECGIILQQVIGKAISSSFAGACASALVIAEVLKAINGGKRCEFLNVHLRDFDLPRSPYRAENYQLRVARNGVVGVQAPAPERLVA